MTWYYADGSNQKGPVSDADLLALAASGVIDNDTLVWYDQLPEWKPYGRVKPSNPTIPLPATPSVPAVPAGSVVCAECRQIFPLSEVIHHGNVYICANCKPTFLQKLKEGIAPAGKLNYAGFGIRGGSRILDVILLYVIMLPANFLLGRFLRPQGTFAVLMVTYPVSISIGAAYYTFFVGKFGATPGKMANKLLVVNPDGSKVGYGKALGRYFSADWISGLFTLCIGYLMAIWDDEKRALHDRICSTRVIRK
ncbi:MAG TPA: RDD family protein [Verrucomicrobiae bacterium]|jgi:uncharacterized RDD family membrane protein YckC